MQTTHKVIFGDANKQTSIEDGSVGLVLTSPPYPMVEMWDNTFSKQNPAIGTALANGEANVAFELMHGLLDEAWKEIYRVLMPGGFACINIGDATRTMIGHFRLFSNHARILTCCIKLGFTNLPPIIWRKQTNAPNKFMGSGMLPAGAYVTLEHEFILILRKGNKRIFKTPAEKLKRKQSALFWEERNAWFSDIWFDLKGTGQELNDKSVRKRSGAFPFDLASRLVNMYSTKEDTVLDPYLGVGTSMLAAITSCRNSIGIEIDRSLRKTIFETIASDVVRSCNRYLKGRLAKHMAFVQQKQELKGEAYFKHRNKPYGFPVMTSQETELLLNSLEKIESTGRDTLTATYVDEPITDFGETQHSLFSFSER